MRKMKKMLCVFFAGALMLSAVGCGSKGNNGGKNSATNAPGKSSEAKKGSADYTFEEDPDYSIDGFVGSIGDMVVADDKIYFNTSEWLEDASEGDASEEEVVTETDVDASTGDILSDESYISNGSAISRIYSAPLDGGTAELLYEKEEESESYLDRIVVKPDGTLYAVKANYTEESTQYKLFELEGSDLKEKMDLSDISDDPNAYLCNLLFDNEGNMITVFDNQIKVLDDNMKEIANISSDDYFDSSAIDKDGDFIATVSAYDEATETSDTLIKKLDMDKGAFGDSYSLGVSYLPYSDGISKGSGDYDFYYRTSSSLFGFKYSDKKSTKLVDFSGSDISEDMIDRFEMLSPDEFISTSWEWDGQDSICSFHKFRKVDPSQVEDRVILTLATPYGNYDLSTRVTEYNKSQSKYRIKLIDYSEENDPLAKMSADIAAGDIPDLFDVSYGVGDMSMNQCIAKGLFEDLTPYLEKDEEISKEDFIPSVYESMLHDGKLYSVSSGFTLDTLVAKKSEVGEERGWTFQDMKDYVETKPEGTYLFYSNNKTDILSSFMYGCGADFVDWDKGECYFDSDDFKDILEMCNRGTNDEMTWDEESPSTYKMVQDGTMLFVDGSITPEQFELYDKMFDDDIVYKGYPNKDKNGTYFQFVDSIAMSSKCADKDAAWDFIRQFMTEEYQSKNYNMSYGVPTREDVYEAYVESMMCTKEGKDKYGNDIYPNEGGYGWDDLEVEIKPLTQEQMDSYRELIDSAKGVYEYDNNVYEIVEEEAAAYFNGDKSVDEVVKIIQNRVTTYVNENK